MNSNQMKRPIPSKGKHRKQKKAVFITLFLLLLIMLIALGWFVIQGIAQAITTGDMPATGTTTAATATEATTTTTATTRPTISVSATLSSSRIVVYDVTHSSLLYSSNANEKCSPASLTKLMTAIIATEQCTADEVFTVGTEQSLLQPDSSVANLDQGYKLTRDMIIDALLLPSGNDAAYTIAAHVGRKVNGDQTISDIQAIRVFIELMNKKLQEIGATNSHFSDPDGYYDANHYTTATDMLLIAKKALQYDNLRISVAKTTVTYTLLSGQSKTWSNTNLMIDPSSSYYFDGATGMKTGYTTEAGYCVVVSAERNGVDLIAVVMGGTSSDTRWRDAVNVLKAAYTAEVAYQ